jgi:hypothetical protein
MKPTSILMYNPSCLHFLDSTQSPEGEKVGITKHSTIVPGNIDPELIDIQIKQSDQAVIVSNIINQPLLNTLIDVPIHCHRCKQMKATKNNPKISTIECGTCMNNYCYDCYDVHKRGKCYMCGESGCYIHEIRKIICYTCL